MGKRRVPASEDLAGQVRDPAALSWRGKEATAGLRQSSEESGADRRERDSRPQTDPFSKSPLHFP